MLEPPPPLSSAGGERPEQTWKKDASSRQKNCRRHDAVARGGGGAWRQPLSSRSKKTHVPPYPQELRRGMGSPLGSGAAGVPSSPTAPVARTSWGGRCPTHTSQKKDCTWLDQQFLRSYLNKTLNAPNRRRKFHNGRKGGGGRETKGQCEGWGGGRDRRSKWK